MDHEYQLSPDSDTYGMMAEKLAVMNADGVRAELIAWRSLLNVNADLAATAATAVAMAEHELARRGGPLPASALNGAAQRILEVAREMVRLAYEDIAKTAAKAAGGAEVEADEGAVVNPVTGDLRDSEPSEDVRAVLRGLGVGELVAELAGRTAILNEHALPALDAIDLIRAIHREIRARGMNCSVELNFHARQLLAGRAKLECIGRKDQK